MITLVGSTCKYRRVGRALCCSLCRVAAQLQLGVCCSSKQQLRTCTAGCIRSRTLWLPRTRGNLHDGGKACPWQAKVRGPVDLLLLLLLSSLHCSIEVLELLLHGGELSLAWSRHMTQIAGGEPVLFSVVCVCVCVCTCTVNVTVARLQDSTLPTRQCEAGLVPNINGTVCIAKPSMRANLAPIVMARALANIVWLHGPGKHTVYDTCLD